MPAELVFFLRKLAATLMSVSGVAHIAALWLRPLTGMALADALLGAVYLIIGIGLFGRSRFALFTAVVIPAVVASVLLYFFEKPENIHILRMTADGVVALCCIIVLWQVRHEPSV